MRSAMAVGVAVLTAGVTTTVPADVIEFTDKAEWEAAAGAFVTADFTGFEDGEPMTDQYEYLGVLFTSPIDSVKFNPVTFPNDDWGLDGNAWIELQFAQPMQVIAADFPGDMRFALFSGEEELYVSSWFGGVGEGFFAGLVSDEPFDRVEIWDPDDDQVSMDDLHFGPPIPTPGALAMIGLALLPSRRRRVR